MELLGLIAIFICCYIGAILMVMAVKGVSTAEAKKVVDTFLKDVIAPASPTIKPDYGIRVGIDDMNYPMADVIEGYFEPLRKVFKDFYLANCTCTQNHYIYSFVVDEPTEEMDDESLYKYCLRTCNNIMHRAIHKEQPWFGSMQNMIAIELQNGMLSVYVARNDDGRRDNIMLTRRIRFLLKHSNRTYSAPLETDWSESQ